MFLSAGRCTWAGWACCPALYDPRMWPPCYSNRLLLWQNMDKRAHTSSRCLRYTEIQDIKWNHMTLLFKSVSPCGVHNTSAPSPDSFTSCGQQTLPTLNVEMAKVGLPFFAVEVLSTRPVFYQILYQNHLKYTFWCHVFWTAICFQFCSFVFWNLDICTFSQSSAPIWSYSLCFTSFLSFLKLWKMKLGLSVHQPIPEYISLYGLVQLEHLILSTEMITYK